MNNKKVAIITGAANGLGYELAKPFVRDGYLVVGVDLDKTNLEAKVKELGDSFIPFCGNIADDAFVHYCVESASKLGDINILINNGGSPSFKEPNKYEPKDVRRCMEGLFGMIYFSTEVLKIMEEGKIINIMSSAALRGNAKESVYCATKWGERGYTESLKAAYPSGKIRICGVYPGGIDTNFYKDSRDYVNLEKQHSFMPAKSVAETIYHNLIETTDLYVDDLVLNRIK